MLKFLSKTLLKLIGWQTEITLPEEKKFVLIGAPHTSNWDLPIAILAFWTFDLKVNWVGKIQMFRGPLYYFFTALGGIPVDRSSPHGFVEKIVNKFQQSDDMVLSISPEGTRSKTKYWKSGFYYIALTAKVPICFGYIDFKTREIGFKEILHPSGDIEADMRIIAQFYAHKEGKKPLNQGPVQVRPL